MSSASAFNALAVAVWVSVGAYNNVDVLGDLSQHWVEPEVQTHM